MTDTLKSICEQCPHLNNPQLDFIPARFPRHRETILRDLKEIVSAASIELEKSVVIAAGSTMEALLYSFIQDQEAFISERRGESFIFDPDHDLRNFVSVFNKYFSDVLSALPDIVVDYRNLVHFNREINSPLDICVRGSREMLRMLDVLLGDLERFGSSAAAG